MMIESTSAGHFFSMGLEQNRCGSHIGLGEARRGRRVAAGYMGRAEQEKTGYTHKSWSVHRRRAKEVERSGSFAEVATLA